MKVLVFNGWAAGLETWALTSFPRDWTFSYVEQMDGLPERVAEQLAEPLVLVGFSMGGVFAQKLFLRNPARVKGLVLVSSTPRMLEDKATGWKGMSEHRLSAFRFGTKLVYRDNHSSLFDPPTLDRGLDCLHDTDLRPELEAYAHERKENARSPDLPVFIFQSERDGIVRPTNAAYFKSVFPQAVVTMVPGSEHTLPVVIPEQIDAAVYQILSTSDRSTQT